MLASLPSSSRSLMVVRCTERRLRFRVQNCRPLVEFFYVPPPAAMGLEGP